MIVNAIFAKSKNGVIGNDNTIPWHLPEDLVRFKFLTSGFPIIMGYNTYLSLKEKPLPNRFNIVLTSDINKVNSLFTPVTSVGEALQEATEWNSIHNVAENNHVFVIGGLQIYNLFQTHIQHYIVTEIHKEFDGNVLAPKITSDFKEISRDYEHSEKTGVDYDVVIYKRT